MEDLVQITPDNEAQVVYEMYKANKTLEDIEFDSPCVAKEGIAHYVIQGKTLTITYADGAISTYTDPE